MRAGRREAGAVQGRPMAGSAGATFPLAARSGASGSGLLWLDFAFMPEASSCPAQVTNAFFCARSDLFRADRFQIEAVLNTQFERQNGGEMLNIGFQLLAGLHAFFNISESMQDGCVIAPAHLTPYFREGSVAEGFSKKEGHMSGLHDVLGPAPGN